ncbi:hypothetical protein TMU01_13260 [Tenuibacillus multivorans]|nr:AbrB family transcriptional regulator [Tenuibacillus multivorans]GEL77091.1 hypothetical protein TMU01_13260 [Tenuibacillus multivorans]
MFLKIYFLMLALILGVLFTILKVPTGWLLGGLIAGIVFNLNTKGSTLSLPEYSFKVGLALIGINIGLIITFKNILAR